MKSYIKYILTIPYILLTLTSCFDIKVKDGDYTFEIYATNDIHGRFFDSLYVSSLDGHLVNKHSLASIATVIEDSRAKAGDDNVILLDIGDHLQGDNAAFYFNFIDTVSPHIFPRIANYMRYDAVVVGNHDIETGHNVYDRVKDQFDMPYLAANALISDSDNPYFEPYTIIKRHGLKIAVIGMTNPNIPSWLAPEIWSGMYFEEIVPSLQRWISYVREKENPHFLIVAMHAGLGDEDRDNIENPARYVTKHIKGIDLVFASHDHRVTAEKHFNGDKEVWLLEGGARASNLSRATLSLSIIDGSVAAMNVEAETLKIEGIEPSVEYMSKFREDFLAVKHFTNRIIGTLENDIDSRDAYFGPSSYVDMIHSVQLRASGADISFVAPLSFNKHISKGELNYQNLLDIYPFENQLNVIELSGEEIKNYLEYSYSLWVNPNPSQSNHLLNFNDGVGERFRLKNPHYNFDSAAGIIYEVDITKPVGQRVIIKSMTNGDIFDFAKKYNVALTSYRASGGGDLLTNGADIDKDDLQSRIVSRLSDIREVIYDQLQADGKISAEKRNEWKFIPEPLVKRLSQKDYKEMFGM